MGDQAEIDGDDQDEHGLQRFQPLAGGRVGDEGEDAIGRHFHHVMGDLQHDFRG